jgi:hypothetical protein
VKLPDIAAQSIVDDLEATAVISERFKKSIIAGIYATIESAYNRGYEAGKKFGRETSAPIVHPCPAHPPNRWERDERTEMEETYESLDYRK